jgi:ketosteroid isomerase-like protein
LLTTLSLLPLACGEPPPAKPPEPPPIVSSAPPSVTPAPPPASSTSPAPPAPAEKPLAELQLASLKAAAEAINAHDGARYVALFTPNVIQREAAAPDVVGRANLAKRMQLLFDAFPDMKFSFDHVWQKGNVAVATWRWTGTDRGGYLQKKPTGRRAGLQGVVVGFYNTDGLVREIHVYDDGQTVAAQLDASSKPGTFRAPPADSTAPLEVTASSVGADEEKNLTAVNKLYELIEAKKEAESAAFFADGATVDDFALAPRALQGGAAWKAMLKTWTGTFGSFNELPLHNVMAIGEWVIVERVLRGKMSGADVQLHAADVLQLKDGRVVRFASYSNTLELMSTLGARGVRKG